MLNGRTPVEVLTGETPDISKYLDFGFYDRMWYKENAGIGKTKLARFLGVSHEVGSLMSYWILPASTIPVSRVSPAIGGVILKKNLEYLACVLM